MTSGARSQTEGATTSGERLRPDVILAAIVGSVIEVGALVGIQRPAFLELLGLTEQDFKEPDGLVPFECYIAAWEAVARSPGSADVGIRLGQVSNPRLLGALGYAMVHAATGVEAIRLFDRFRRLVSDTLAPEIDFEEDTVTFHLVWPPRVAVLHQFADAAFMGQISLLSDLCGLPKGTHLAVEAFCQCSEPPGPKRSELFGCPTHYGAPETRLVMRRDLLEQPLPRTDPSLFQYLERHAQAVLDQLPQSTDLAGRVRRIVIDSLRGGEPTPARIAKSLGVSERTLQRRLQGEGTTFARIVDGARRELSEHYLTDPNVAAFEVAFLLGYSEPSAFHRAFRRWTGKTPQEYRRASVPSPAAAPGGPAVDQSA